MVLIEIVCSHPEDVAAAATGGAHRLELCAALETGGLSPGAGLMRAAVASGLPWVAMARPRPGGFLYSQAEFDALLADVDAALDAGAGGVVVGLLRPDTTLDLDRVRRVAERVAGKDLVFHRAFDIAPDPLPDALDRLKEAGVTRLLTSGRAERALDGLANLKEMAQGPIPILPAGGVRAENAARIVRETGVTQLHAAPVSPRNDGTGGLYGAHSGVDAEAVADLVADSRN